MNGGTGADLARSSTADNVPTENPQTMAPSVGPLLPQLRVEDVQTCIQTSAEPPTTKTDEDTTSKDEDLVAVHCGSYCCGVTCQDRWGVPIMGDRYMCVTCDTLFPHNLCASCFSTYPYKHADSPIDVELCKNDGTRDYRLRRSARHLYEPNSPSGHVFLLIPATTAKASTDDIHLHVVQRPDLLQYCLRPTYEDKLMNLEITWLQAYGRIVRSMVVAPWTFVLWLGRRLRMIKPADERDEDDVGPRAVLIDDVHLDGVWAGIWLLVNVGGLYIILTTQTIILGGVARAYTIFMFETPMLAWLGMLFCYPGEASIVQICDVPPHLKSRLPMKKMLEEACTVSDPSDLGVYDLWRSFSWRFRVGLYRVVVTVPAPIVEEQRQHAHASQKTQGSDTFLEVPLGSVDENVTTASPNPSASDTTSSAPTTNASQPPLQMPQPSQRGVNPFHVFGTQSLGPHAPPSGLMVGPTVMGFLQIVIFFLAILSPGFVNATFGYILRVPSYEPYSITHDMTWLCPRFQNDSVNARMALRVRVSPPVRAGQGEPILTTWFIDGTDLSTNVTEAETERHSRIRLRCVVEHVLPTTTRASTATSFTVLVTEQHGGDFVDAIVQFPHLTCADAHVVVPVTSFDFETRLQVTRTTSASTVDVVFFSILVVFIFLASIAGRFDVLTTIDSLGTAWCALDKLVCTHPRHLCKRKRHTKPSPPSSSVMAAPTSTPTHRPKRPTLTPTCGVWVHDVAQFLPMDFAIPDNCAAWWELRSFLRVKTYMDLWGTIEYLHIVLVQAGVSFGVLGYYVVVGTAPFEAFVVLLVSFATSFDAILTLIPLAYIQSIMSSHRHMLTQRILQIKAVGPTQDAQLQLSREAAVTALEAMIQAIEVEDTPIKIFGIPPTTRVLQTLGAIAVSGLSAFVGSHVEFYTLNA